MRRDHYLSIPGPRFVLLGSVLPSPAHNSKYGNNNSTHLSSHNTWSDSKQQLRCQNTCDNILQLTRVCLLMLPLKSRACQYKVQTNVKSKTKGDPVSILGATVPQY